MNKHVSQTVDRPLTGKEYLESLNDGREVWIYGERVKNITSHPAFRNSARMIARVYDAMHDEATRDVITAPTEWNFHPAGPFAQALAAAKLNVADPRRFVATLAALFDPCASCDINLREAQHA